MVAKNAPPLRPSAKEFTYPARVPSSSMKNKGVKKKVNKTAQTTSTHIIASN